VDVTAIVPILGRSPWLASSLEALRREGGKGMEIVVVDQGDPPADLPRGLADRVLRPGRNLGFAAANNMAIAGTAGRLIATVNDDAVVEPGWLAALTAALQADPGAAAVQGVNVLLDDPERIDGCGISWNRWWQAVQAGHGSPAPPVSGEPEEVFGVSATAALFRRKALLAVAPRGEAFDPALVSYYEDVDLAIRLRIAGWRSFVVPAARALHAGSVTGSTLSRERWRLLYGNRYLVAARLLGRSFWQRVPLMGARDLADLARAASRGEGQLALGILSGWGRALRRLPAFTRPGASAVPLGEIRRFR
jgi:GT2 family glycosyltransferase